MLLPWCVSLPPTEEPQQGPIAACTRRRHCNKYCQTHFKSPALLAGDANIEHRPAHRSIPSTVQAGRPLVDDRAHTGQECCVCGAVRRSAHGCPPCRKQGTQVMQRLLRLGGQQPQSRWGGEVDLDGIFQVTLAGCSNMGGSSSTARWAGARGLFDARLAVKRDKTATSAAQQERGRKNACTRPVPSAHPCCATPPPSARSRLHPGAPAGCLHP